MRQYSHFRKKSLAEWWIDGERAIPNHRGQIQGYTRAEQSAEQAVRRGEREGQREVRENSFL